jgi:hypothetical protein
MPDGNMAFTIEYPSMETVAMNIQEISGRRVLDHARLSPGLLGLKIAIQQIEKYGGSIQIDEPESRLRFVCLIPGIVEN